MKKSVVLPFDRYQQLLQNSVPLPVTAVAETPATTQASAQVAPVSVPPTNSDTLDTDIIIACLPKRNRFKAHRLIDFITKI